MAQDGRPFRNDGAGSGRLHGDRLGAGARSSDSVSTDVGRAGRDKNLSFEGIRDGYAVYEVRSGRYGFRVE